MAKTFKFGENGKWATKTGSSLAYNDQNDNFKPMPFSVTRNSIATRVNKQGLIEVVGNDKLRIDYTDSTKGVALLEPARTNLITYSEDFSDSSWTKTGVSITSNVEISPDGSQNASKLIEGAFTGNKRLRINALSTSGDNTLSFFVKAAERKYVLLREAGQTGAFSYFDLENGVKGISSLAENIQIQKFKNDWFRISFKDNLTSVAIELRLALSDGVDSYQGDGTSGVYIWGAQIEAGSYATSYIPTSGQSGGVPREADVANGAGNSEVFNDSEGVLFADIAFTKEAVSGFVTISDGTDDERITIYRVGSLFPNKIQGQIREGNTARVSFGFDTNFVDLYNKIAIKYKANDFAFWVNGFEIDSNTSNTLIPDNLNNLEFAEGDGGNPFNGKSKEIGYYDTALTDAELEALTSYTSFTNMANELNLTIK